MALLVLFWQYKMPCGHTTLTETMKHRSKSRTFYITLCHLRCWRKAGEVPLSKSQKVIWTTLEFVKWLIQTTFENCRFTRGCFLDVWRGFLS